MPKLNKCKHRKKVRGYVDRPYRGEGIHVSSRIWFKCELLEEETMNPQRHSQVECQGWNCGRYEETDLNES